MKNEPSIELKNAILNLTRQIDQLKSKISTCEESNKIYNRLMVDRACLRKKLREMESKNVVSFLYEKIEHKGGQKRICDYFKS